MLETAPASHKPSSPQSKRRRFRRWIKFFASTPLMLICVACIFRSEVGYVFEHHDEFYENGFKDPSNAPFIYDDIFISANASPQYYLDGKIDRSGHYELYVYFVSDGIHDPIFMDNITLSYDTIFARPKTLRKEYGYEFEFLRKSEHARIKGGMFLKDPPSPIFFSIPKKYFNKKTKVTVRFRSGGQSYVATLPLVKYKLPSSIV